MFRNQYDTDVTTWRPAGRLFQVEYAMEAVKQGSAAIGLRSKSHIVLACVNKANNELSSHQKKIFKVDDHIGVAIAGLTADGRVLSRYMRSECINYSFTYEAPLPVGRLVVQLADKAQVCTQRSWNRPYGVGLLVAGLDESGAHLYYNCPSGNYFEYQAFAIGSRSQAAKTYLERKFTSFTDSSRDDLIKHALIAIRETLEGEMLKSSICTIALVGVGESFHVLDQETVQQMINAFEIVTESFNVLDQETVQQMIKATCSSRLHKTCVQKQDLEEIFHFEETTVDEDFPLFKTGKILRPKAEKPTLTSSTMADSSKLEKLKDTDVGDDRDASFGGLGLAEWAVRTCKELGMKEPTPVQSHCIPQILGGRDVLGLAQTGSGKTATFALPILHHLAKDPYGVFSLVITPTRELAYQLAEQFRALGSSLHVRCLVIVGGMDMLNQTQALLSRPHVVISTPGRIKALLDNNPDIPPVFSNTKFLVLDEADRVLDVGFQEELGVVFRCLPKNRQTLLFSATMTSDLRMVLEISANKAYFYEAYEGFRTVDTLRQQYVFIPKTVKDVYLFHILSKMGDMGIRSAIIFVSTCRTCHLLNLLLEELEQDSSALHSLKSQSLRLAALHRFKAGQVPILLATDVASRGLDLPTVDLVVNYDIPRYPKDYVHRVGRTARAGRGGLAVSLVTQNDISLVREIEDVIEKKLDNFNCKENEVLADITKVYKARRVATMKMMDDGFEEKAKERKRQKRKMLAQRGLLKKRQRRKRNQADL